MYEKCNTIKKRALERQTYFEKRLAHEGCDGLRGRSNKLLLLLFRRDEIILVETRESERNNKKIQKNNIW